MQVHIVQNEGETVFTIEINYLNHQRIVYRELHWFLQEILVAYKTALWCNHCNNLNIVLNFW